MDFPPKQTKESSDWDLPIPTQRMPNTVSQLYCYHTAKERVKLKTNAIVLLKTENITPLQAPQKAPYKNESALFE